MNTEHFYECPCAQIHFGVERIYRSNRHEDVENSAFGLNTFELCCRFVGDSFFLLCSLLLFGLTWPCIPKPFSLFLSLALALARALSMRTAQRKYIWNLIQFIKVITKTQKGQDWNEMHDAIHSHCQNIYVPGQPNKWRSEYNCNEEHKTY